MYTNNMYMLRILPSELPTNCSSQRCCQRVFHSSRFSLPLRCSVQISMPPMPPMPLGHLPSGSPQLVGWPAGAAPQFAENGKEDLTETASGPPSIDDAYLAMIFESFGRSQGFLIICVLLISDSFPFPRFYAAFDDLCFVSCSFH